MARVLVVIRAISQVRNAVRARAARLAKDDELAVCLVHDADGGGVGHLQLQRQMTVQLRVTLGAAAEAVATFVVSGRDGDDVASCAAGWGATMVDDAGVSGGDD